ncbi:MAG TPA: hypothetical protein PLC59_01325 [Bacteroidales bacterium]|nr:hypothetical protein [Bacteroidales bacterium]
MKILKYILGIIILSSFCSDNYSIIKTIPSDASFITTDNLGNLYLVQNNEVLKYDNNGSLLKTYSNKISRNINFMDVTNPLQILLFDKDFRQIIFLDNMLSPINDPIVLDDIEMIQPLLVCTSYENGFWVYDHQNFQIIRFDKNRKKTNQSGNIYQDSGIHLNPNFMMESGNRVFVNNPDTGIFVFDKYGTYDKLIPLKNLSSFQIMNQEIIFFKNNHLVKFNIKSFEEQIMEMPFNNAIMGRFEKNRLFLQDSVSINIYKNN